jgi:hypothetical protein
VLSSSLDVLQSVLVFLESFTEVESAQMMLAEVKLYTAQIVVVHDRQTLPCLGEHTRCDNGTQHLHGFLVVTPQMFKVTL